MSSCCLCSSLVSDYSRDFWNRPLFESANFAVVPSLGSLVEGWVLIVPKQHFVCVGALPADLLEELKGVRTAVGELLRPRYGDLCAFEHGPHAVNREVGCGVDHAHLHVLPLSVDLVSAAARFLPQGVRWMSAELETCRTVFANGQDYLYIEQPMGSGRIATDAHFGSQILRKAIAAHLGIPREFSWRDHPQLDIVARTIRELGGSAEVRV